jgi:hypothetical protein
MHVAVDQLLSLRTTSDGSGAPPNLTTKYHKKPGEGELGHQSYPQLPLQLLRFLNWRTWAGTRGPFYSAVMACLLSAV